MPSLASEDSTHTHGVCRQAEHPHVKYNIGSNNSFSEGLDYAQRFWPSPSSLL